MRFTLPRFLAALAAPFVLTAQAQGVGACGGEAYWPPMSYLTESNTEVQGISADVLRAVIPPPETLRIQLRPWPRCVQEVHRLNGFDIVMALLRNSEREQQFLFSRPYHQLTPAYVFVKERFPQPPVLRLDDLAELKVCALAGASVTYTRLPAERVDSGARSHAALLGKLDRGYCDVVVEMQEVMAGLAKLGLVPWGEGRYRMLALPQTERYPLHFGVSKEHPQGQALIARIDKGMLDLQRRGKLQAIVLRHQAESRD